MPDLEIVHNLTFLVSLVGTLCIIGVLFWRVRVQQQNRKRGYQFNQHHLEASFLLGGYLLEAQNEETAILAAMRVGQDLLEVEGCAFVPLNEWNQLSPNLKLGDLPFLQELNWDKRLREPATRHKCRNCKEKQAGVDCILFKQTGVEHHAYCVVLRCDGREVGVISYFFPNSPQVTAHQQSFIAELVRITDLALSALRLHAQELDTLRNIQPSNILKNDLLDLKIDNKDLLDQLEYRAVLDERSRLAREIHDGLAQTLAFLKMETARLQMHIAKGETALLTETLQAYYQTLSEAYLDARQAIDNLRHVPDANLAEWLDMTASGFRTLTGLTVEVSNVELEYAFPNSIKAQLIRIVQEALTNIRKHAQSCTVSISAFERSSEVIIEVKDNGRGFAPEDVDTVAQYGLRSMRERAESIGADFQVISAPGMGTTIRLQIPIREKANR